VNERFLISFFCTQTKHCNHAENGFGSISKPEKFFNQDYQQLTEYCITRGLRYIDNRFPPDKNSIGYGILSPSDMNNVTWLRPAKIVPNPSFIVQGISRFDFGQGILGNCWFLASLGALTFQTDIFKQVVPVEQTFDKNYCGLFHFRFWRFGQWVDVVIDDKLPTVNGRLIFARAKYQNEFWPALLEKAYAKYGKKATLFLTYEQLCLVSKVSVTIITHPLTSGCAVPIPT
uniref:Calpain catalytic domain-containing protein n=1 Tax=Mola mola TaxID=94237 RepID=A0A3Q3W3S6_MOLML